MASVRLDHVTKVFRDRSRGEVVAVNDVTFTIADGEFTVLVGPSGCGKTTTLRLIAGLEQQTSGTVYIGERLVNKLHPKERDIAMVFQDYALYPHMTVYENLSFGLQNLRVPRDEIEKQVQGTSSMLGISELLERRPRELSGGQRQRVAVGRAIVRSPQVFLFDEPLSNLDAKLRVQMRVELAELHNRLGTTMVYVTHDQVEAMTLGQRIVVMNHGIVQQIDDPRTLYDEPANLFVASFIGAPAMNFFEGKIDVGDGTQFAGDGYTIRLPERIMDTYGMHDQQGVILGVRPEDIRMGDEDLGQLEPGKVRGRVRVIEYLGSEMLLYFSLGKRTYTARMDPQTVVQENGDAVLLLSFDRADFFDPESEMRLVPRT